MKYWVGLDIVVVGRVVRGTASEAKAVFRHTPAYCIFLIGRGRVNESDGTAGDSASMPQLPLARTSCSCLPVAQFGL